MKFKNVGAVFSDLHFLPDWTGIHFARQRVDKAGKAERLAAHALCSSIIRLVE